MADKISANITYVDTDNNKGSKAITDISPTADNGAIKNFCVGLLGLTTNTLSQIDRVEKTDITNATPKPKLSLDVYTETLATLQLNSDTMIWDSIANWDSSRANFPKIYCSYSYTQDGYVLTDLSKSFGFGVEEQLAVIEPSNCLIKVYLAPHAISGGNATLTADFLFEETPVTQETIYRLTITGTAGEATFVQL